jgi:hypothetical protein
MRVLLLILLFVGVSFGQFDADPLRDLVGDIDAAVHRACFGFAVGAREIQVRNVACGL